MRRPSTRMELWAYWTQATGGAVSHPLALRRLAARHDEDPEVGYYRTRMVRGGPWVPVEVRCLQPIGPDGLLIADEEMRARIDGEEFGAGWLERRWLFLRPISRSAFAELTAMRGRSDGVGDLMRATNARVNLSLEPVRP